jgi:hypothetical protein
MSLVQQFAELGISLVLEGELLRYRAPVGVMTPELLGVLSELKPLVIEELSPVPIANLSPPVAWGDAIAGVFQKLRDEMTPLQQTEERKLRESLGHAGPA